MIVFIDESYKKDSKGTWHYALAGFGVDEFRYRALQAATYQLIRKYFAVTAEYEGDSWRLALGDKIIVEKSSNEIELKGESLLSSSNLRRFGGEESPHYRLVDEVLEKVNNCRGTCLGVLVNPADPQDVKDCSRGCPSAYVRLIHIIGKWMAEQHPNQSVTLVLDTEHNAVNLPLSRSIADYLYKSSNGRNLKHVFPSPFWIDSQSMSGAQVADLVAHILMNSMMPETERKQIDRLWSRVNGMRSRWNSGRGGTITRQRKAAADGG